MVRVEVLRTRTELETLSGVWNGLLEKSECDNVFLTWEWVSHWVDAYLADGELLTLAVSDGARPVALAPLCVQRERIPVIGSMKVLRFVGAGEACPDHVDMIVNPEGAERWSTVIWGELLGPLRREWDIFEYYDAPANSQCLDAFLKLALEDKRCGVAEHVGHSVCPYLALPPTWDEFLGRCSANRRYAIKYSLKQLASQGELVFRFCEGSGELSEHMGTFISLHQKSWKERGEPGAFASDRFKRFHMAVAKEFLRKEILFLCSLDLGGSPIASFYGFLYNRRLYYYLMGAQPNPVKRVKTGETILAYAIQEAIRRGCREFDFLRGGEEYKYRWTSTDRRNPRVRFYNRTAKAFAFFVGSRARRRARKLRDETGGELTRNSTSATPPTDRGNDSSPSR